MYFENLVYLKILFEKIAHYFWLKIISVMALVGTNLLFDSANLEAYIALFFLIVLDFITGIFASYQTGVEIKSAKIFRTAIKIIVYYGMITAGLWGVRAGIPILPLDSVIIAFLAATELISVLENMANLGYIIPRRLVNRLKKFRDDED